MLRIAGLVERLVVVLRELYDNRGLVKLVQGRRGGQSPFQRIYDDGHLNLDVREGGREGGRGEVSDQM